MRPNARVGGRVDRAKKQAHNQKARLGVVSIECPHEASAFFKGKVELEESEETRRCRQTQT